MEKLIGAGKSLLRLKDLRRDRTSTWYPNSLGNKKTSVEYDEVLYLRDGGGVSYVVVNGVVY
jgi:hypothetical protein